MITINEIAFNSLKKEDILFKLNENLGISSEKIHA
jgi:hypothetical protein